MGSGPFGKDELLAAVWTGLDFRGLMAVMKRWRQMIQGALLTTDDRVEPDELAMCHQPGHLCLNL